MSDAVSGNSGNPSAEPLRGRPPAPPSPPGPPLAVSVETFRKTLRAFRDPEMFPDEMIALWLRQAECAVNADWGCFYNFGLMMWAAHELWKLHMAEIADPDNPLGIDLPIQSKSVGPVSVSFDTSLGQEDPAAGQYNLTLYGRQYFHYATRVIGIGPWQIGAVSPVMPLSGHGWRGPPPWVGWFSG